MAHILITGGAGYAGSVLIDRLLAGGHKVTVADWMVFGDYALLPHRGNSNFALLRLDVRALPPRALEGVDAICDLAALASHEACDLDPVLTRDINVHARARLARIASAVGVKRYVLASSCAVYGAASGKTATESGPAGPDCLYAECALEAENAVLALDSPEFTVTSLRLSTLFGLSRRMRFDLLANVMTRDAVREGKLFIHGDGAQSRALLHVRDAARAFADVLEAPESDVAGKVFNIGIGNFTIADIAQIIRTVVPGPLETVTVPAPVEARNNQVSFDAMRDQLGFEPEVGLADGIMELYIALATGRTTDSLDTRTAEVYAALINARQLHLYQAAGS